MIDHESSFERRITMFDMISPATGDMAPKILVPVLVVLAIVIVAVLIISKKKGD